MRIDTHRAKQHVFGRHVLKSKVLPRIPGRIGGEYESPQIICVSRSAYTRFNLRQDQEELAEPTTYHVSLTNVRECFGAWGRDSGGGGRTEDQTQIGVERLREGPLNTHHRVKIPVPGYGESKCRQSYWGIK